MNLTWFKGSMLAALTLTFSAGTWLAILDRKEAAVARAEWRQEMDAKYGAGAVGDGRGSEYGLVGSIGINSLIVGVFSLPIGFIIGGGMGILRDQSRKHEPNKAVNPSGGSSVT